MPNDMFGYVRHTFITVLLTLIFIYVIRVVSLKYDIPFMRNVVTNQQGSV